MKKIFLFISLWGLFSTGLLAPSVLLASESNVSSETPFYDEDSFELHNYLDNGQMRSPSCPFEVTITGQSITIHYLVPLDKVHVEITDKLGQVVYSNTANAEADAQWFIDMKEWKPGDYNFSLTDSSRNCVYEPFKIAN